ncbi:MAG: nucleotidyltransferase domain-containing protein [Rhodobacteraceae bacterium]|nr:nucleotidyltransferase domain-containing protein [Paracoccaceae bacterium]
MLSSVVDLAQVDRVFIIGSITGYKYTSTSDIDINVVLNQTTTKNESTNAHLNARQINGVPAIGGKHPINFFIKSYSKSRDWDTYLFGVYDVLNNF